MTRTAFLHIGLPKTGTTYLQEIVWANKPALEAAGLLMLGDSHRAHLLASVDVRESDRLEKRAGAGATPWQDLVDDAARWSGDVLVSHEFFCAALPPQIERMLASLAGFEVRVLITARSMSRLAVSRWQEWVKNGGKDPVDSYPSGRSSEPARDWGWGSFDLADVLDRWGSVVPPSQITVIVVDTDQAPERLWQRFAGHLGVDGSAYAIPEQAANPSLGVVEVELLRRVNAKLEGFGSAADRGTWIRGYLAEGGVLPQRKATFRASDAKQADLAARDARAVSMLRDGAFVVDGDLALLQQEVPSTWRQPSDVTDAELVDSATTTIANLMRDVRALTRERNSLRRSKLRRDPREGKQVGPVRHRLKRRWAQLVGASSRSSS